MPHGAEWLRLAFYADKLPLDCSVHETSVMVRQANSGLFLTLYS